MFKIQFVLFGMMIKTLRVNDKWIKSFYGLYNRKKQQATDFFCLYETKTIK